MHTIEQLSLALAGRYTIDRLIGEGGMATVYLARDLKHQRRVALKVLKPDLGAALGVERFLSEIQVTANLQHPNLLPLFDSGATDSLLFYVMPFVEGESLRHRINRERQLPIDDAVRIATAVGSALDYAHRHGVIHRDLKPENILLHEGQPLVADFGIALAVSNAGGNRITQTGLSLGTPQYMSPEQATGDRVIDSRSDIYSLGALTYEMLTGEPPHTGATSQAIIARLLTERPRGIRVTRPNVSENIEAAVERALEKIPADRWETAKEFSEALAGTRVVTRPAVSMQFAVQKNVQRSMSAGSADGLTAIAVVERTRRREMIAWVVGAIGIAVATFAFLRPAAHESPGVAAEFEVELPDSLAVVYAGGSAMMALSADGSTLVFQGARPGEMPALFVRRLDERLVQKINGTDSAASPAFTFDGEEILFTRLRGEGGRGGRGAGGRIGGQGGGGVISGPFGRISIRGGTARSFGDSSQSGSPVSWGDNDRIVMSLRSRLYTFSANGGKRTLLAAPDTGQGHRRYTRPDVLPDGDAALFVIGKGPASTDTSVLGVVSIPDGKVTELGIDGFNPHYAAVGGGYIVFATADANLYAVPFDAAKRRLMGAPFLLVEGVRVGGRGAASFSVSQNGTLAYVAGDAAASESVSLVAVTRAGAERNLGLQPGLYSHPRVSPNGSQIALTRGTAIGGPMVSHGYLNPDIFRFDISSKALSRVTADSDSRVALWSADGERIAFTRQGGTDVASWRPLYASGQTDTLVRTSDPMMEVSLGPAHSYATLAVRHGASGDSRDIWLAHMDSLDKPRPFLTQPYGEYSGRVSPDGSLIAFVTTRTGRSEVYVQPLHGGGEVQVSAGGGEEPVWAANSREIFFRGSRMIAAQLAVRPTLSVTRRDTLFTDTSRFIRAGPTGWRTTNYDVLPGGNEFVMLKANPIQRIISPPIIVMVNWHLRTLRNRE